MRRARKDLHHKLCLYEFRFTQVDPFVDEPRQSLECQVPMIQLSIEFTRNSLKCRLSPPHPPPQRHPAPAPPPPPPPPPSPPFIPLCRSCSCLHGEDLLCVRCPPARDSDPGRRTRRHLPSVTRSKSYRITVQENLTRPREVPFGYSGVTLAT